MKKLLFLALALTIAFPAFGALSEREENDLREILAEKTNIINLAKGVTDETIPRQIKIKQNELAAIIATRDSDVLAKKVQRDNEVQSIETAAQVLIDAKQSEIDNLRAQL